jgi:hypothetical protein
MKFLIQTIDSRVEHDFSSHLLDSLRFYREFKKVDIEYDLSDHILEGSCKDYIPVGGVEFINEFFKEKRGIDLKPINVPECLFPYSNRKIVNLQRKEYGRIPEIFQDDRRLFIKCNNTVKHKMLLNSYRVVDSKFINSDNVQVSEIIEVEAEYRCFIYEDKLIDVRRYSGDFTLFPDIAIVRKMIEVYKPKSPKTYTLDIGINKDGVNFVIEVHDFYSCGLYGFNNLQHYPYMLANWYFFKTKDFFLKI